MAIFIAALSKRGGGDPLRDVDFSAYLPFEPVTIDQVVMGSASLKQFSFGAALDRPICRSSVGALSLQGYGGPELGNELLVRIFDRQSMRDEDYPEAFCCVAIRENGVGAYSSATGVDQVFMLKTESAVYLTNRHNLLGPFLNDVSFNRTSFMWMAGRTHIGELGTYWNEVERIKPGFKVQCTTAEEVRVSPHALHFNSISEEECVGAIDDFVDDFASVLEAIPADKRIWLSGGKDSRAILGLLDYAGALGSVSIITGGELFSPDVMAATDVVQLIGAAKQHVVNRPSLVTAEVDLAQRIAKDLAADFTGSSLADLKGLNRTNQLIIGGHENGFKAKANALGLDDYIKSRKYWVDNQTILRDDDRAALLAEYGQSLRGVLADAPVSRYGQIDLAHFRNHTFLPSAFSGSHVAASEVHPFLDGRLFRLLCGISNEALNAQLIHYLMMRKSSRALESVAFAADRWPDGLSSVATRIKLPLRGTMAAPYSFNSAFPSQRSFGMYDWRLKMLSLSRPFTESYLRDNGQFFDFVNFERLDVLMRTAVADLKFSEMYTVLGLYKMALVHMIGTRALRFSEADGITEEVGRTLRKAAVGVPVASEGETKSTEAMLKEKLAQYDDCIVEMVRQLREEAAQGADLYRQAFSDTVGWLFDVNVNSPDFQLRLRKIAVDAGYVELEGEGFELTRFEQVHAGTRIKVAADVIMNHANTNSLLIAFHSNVPNLIPVGFVASPKGFYYRYVNTSAYSSSISMMVEFPEGAIVPEDGRASLRLMPWYSSEAIYIRGVAKSL